MFRKGHKKGPAGINLAGPFYFKFCNYSKSISWIAERRVEVQHFGGSPHQQLTEDD
jgi:hypothetical protein